MNRKPTHLPPEDTRAGEKSGRMRIVLLASTGLAALALAAILATWLR